jgi:hypothetical protein
MKVSMTLSAVVCLGLPKGAFGAEAAMLPRLV